MNEIEGYKKQIDDDFKVFPINKRLIRLERAWIRDISHQIMKRQDNFVHDDRVALRRELFKYLKNKAWRKLRGKKNG
jgi:hypothetical protein